MAVTHPIIFRQSRLPGCSAGPIDYTPGVFNIKFDEYKKENQVNTTLAHQLALYVVIYSPIQMVCDLPEHYYENGKIHPYVPVYQRGWRRLAIHPRTGW
jgi:hypothetical protein